MPGISILCVDDEPDLLNICKLFLEKTGDFNVDTAESAHEALEMMGTTSYDAVVSDYQMPEMDGIAFLKHLKAAGDTTPFIIITGRGREDVVIEALNEGADFYLQKGGNATAQFAELANKILYAVSRKRAEEALRESEEKYRHLIEHSNDAIVVAQDGMLRLVNARAVEITGYSREELLSLPFPTFIHPDDRGMVVERFEKRIGGDETLSRYTFRVVTREGDIRWVEIIADVIEWKERPATLNFLTDITERKRAVDALLESEGRFLSLFDRSLDCVFIHDLEGTFIDANPAALALLGYTREDIPRITFASLIGTDQLDLARGTIRTILENGSHPDLVEYRLSKKGGGFVDVEVKGSLILHEGAPYAILGIARDITERKRTEKELRESRDRLDFAIQGAHLGTWDVDCATGTITHNVRWHELLGYSGEGTTTNFDWWADRIHPDDVSLVEDLYRAHIMGRTPVLDMTCRIRKADGAWIWIRTIGRVIERDDQGTPLRISGINQDVTELKQAEFAIREREEKFREIFNNMNDAIHLHEVGEDGRPGKFIEVNDVACQMLQYTRDEMLQMGPLDIAIAYHSRPFDILLEELRTVGHAKFDTGHRRKDGQIIPVEVNAHKIMLLGRTMVLSVVRDITERKRTEEALRESEARYREFFATSRDCVFITSPEGVWIDFNDASLDLFGYRTREELAAVPIQDLYENADFRTGFNAIIIRDGYAENHPVRLKKKDGTIIDTLITSVPLMADDGSVKEFFGTIRDVTEKKRAEEEISSLQQFQQSIINNANVWISVFDEKGNVSVWNNTAEEISGYKAGEVIGKNSIWDRIYPEMEYRRTIMTKMNEIVETVRHLENFETRIRTKDGQERIIWWNTRALHDVPGINHTFIAIGKDVTDQKILNDAMLLANKKLNLLGSITRHDINNQLMVLRGYLELMHGALPDSSLEGYYNGIANSGDRIATMIQFTKEYEQIGVNAPAWQNCRTLVDSAAHQVPLGTIIVKNDLPVGTEVFADPLITRVCYNLMDNAVGCGGKITTIRFSGEERGEAYHIACEDDGVGIPDDKKEKIFERGYGRNTGMGLFLSREILSITGITIRETGEPGKGARFEIIVPGGMFRFVHPA